ncbi:hypothetical protein Q1695_011550 [Nippostrongylus brasiliensis]|nr:hypothetical protein Q1695_011550 [Nippostrongylus brasiliensis]
MACWARWKGWDKQRWYELLTTDSGFGSLGTTDTHITRPYISAIRTTEVTVPSGDGWRKFLSIVAPEHKRTKQEMNRQYRPTFDEQRGVNRAEAVCFINNPLGTYTSSRSG